VFNKVTHVPAPFYNAHISHFVLVKYDVDGSETLSQKEIRNALESVSGQPLDDGTVQAVLSEIDKVRDGVILRVQL